MPPAMGGRRSPSTGGRPGAPRRLCASCGAPSRPMRGMPGAARGTGRASLGARSCRRRCSAGLVRRRRAWPGPGIGSGRARWGWMWMSSWGAGSMTTRGFAAADCWFRRGCGSAIRSGLRGRSPSSPPGEAGKSGMTPTTATMRCASPPSASSSTGTGWPRLASRRRKSRISGPGGATWRTPGSIARWAWRTPPSPAPSPNASKCSSKRRCRKPSPPGTPDSPRKAWPPPPRNWRRPGAPP